MRRGYDVLVLSWNPICGRLGKAWEKAHQGLLTEAEADRMVEELRSCVDEYRGQGQTLHGARKELST